MSTLCFFGFVCVCIRIHLSAALWLYFDRNIGKLSLQMEVLFFISAWFCLLSSNQTLHIFSLPLPQLPLKATHTRALTRPCARLNTALTHICKTNKTDRLWSLKELLKMSASNFYCTRMHTHAYTRMHAVTLFYFYFTHSIFSQSRFAYWFWCCLLFMSQIAWCDPVALFILSLLKEILFFQLKGAGFLIAINSWNFKIYTSVHLVN